MQPEFSRVLFRDPAKAESNLERLTQKLASSVMGPLASLLMPSSDPDGALNLLDRYVQACPPEVLGAIAQTPTALTYLVAVFGYSTFLAETLLAEPALAVQFARDRNFTKLKSQEDLLQDFARFTTTNPDPSFRRSWRGSSGGTICALHSRICSASRRWGRRLSNSRPWPT